MARQLRRESWKVLPGDFQTSLNVASIARSCWDKIPLAFVDFQYISSTHKDLVTVLLFLRVRLLLVERHLKWKVAFD